jgi:hypothetical protein
METRGLKTFVSLFKKEDGEQAIKEKYCCSGAGTANERKNNIVILSK